MSADCAQGTVNQNSHAVNTAVVENSKTSDIPLSTSIDSGIHDVVIKQEPVDDFEVHDTVVSDLSTNTGGVIKVKKEPVENASSAIERKNHEALNAGMSIENNRKNEETIEGAKVEEGTSKQENDDTEKSTTITDAVSDQSQGLVKESADGNKAEKVSEEKVETTSDPDVVIVENTSNMMDYRSAETVVTLDDTSDSSPDSSDSDTDSGHSEEKIAESTEAQVNKIMSSERDVSPDREKRVKMNRHGFEDIRTRGELLPEELPPLEELTITVDESVVMVEVGSIKSIVGILVVIQSNENVPPLDDETILFVEGHKVLGQVFEVFGPVKTPWYSVRFNEVENIEAKGLKVGMPVFCAPREKSFTKFVFVDSLKTVKGSDASWEDNNEPPEKHIDYSDDEAERRAKAKRRNKKGGENDSMETDEGETMGQRKNPRNRNRNKQHRNDQQEVEQHKKAWNPFQGNQNIDNNNASPRFGQRPQHYDRNSQPPGQRWPRPNYNRPQSRFGGPPNFQNRPRMDQHQGQQPLTRSNPPCQNNWRQPMKTGYPNNQQNYEFIAQPLGNCPPQTGSPFNPQSPPPQPLVSRSNFGSNQGQFGQSGPGPLNVDLSQPPPQLQFGKQIRPPAQFTGTNSWNRPPVSSNQSNIPFNNQPVPVGTQSLNLMNPGNQMFNQGQLVNFPTSESNQQFSTVTLDQPEINASQVSQVNFPRGPNIQQNPFSHTPANNRSGFQPGSSSFHQNINPLQTQTVGQQVTNVQNSTAACYNVKSGYGNDMHSGPAISGSHNASWSDMSAQGQNVGNYSGQNMSVQAQQSFHQNNLQNGRPMAQFDSTQGFQGNLMQNQTPRQPGFNSFTSGNPSGANMFMPAGSSLGQNQVRPGMQPSAIVDQRYIQNNT